MRPGSRPSTTRRQRHGNVGGSADSVALEQRAEGCLRVGRRERAERFERRLCFAERDAGTLAGEARQPVHGRRLECRIVRLQHQGKDVDGVDERDDARQLARRRPHAGEIAAGKRSVEAGADDGERWRHLERTFADGPGGTARRRSPPLIPGRLAAVSVSGVVTSPADPLRMYLVLRRGAVSELARAGELAGAAAVACVRAFGADPAFAVAVATWRPRPGKVCLRARSDSQWRQALGEPHALAGDPEGEAALAIPPRPRSQRGALLERMQAMSSDLPAAPARAPAADHRRAVTYLLNPSAKMSSGKTVAQVAHAAVMAADTGAIEDWVAAGCPGRVLAPTAEVFGAMAAWPDVLARVVDAGLTEVPAGTVTVVALPPAPSGALPEPLAPEPEESTGA